STDNHVAENSFSFICINAIAGIEIRSTQMLEFKLPGENPEKLTVRHPGDVPQLLWDFMQRFEMDGSGGAADFARGLYGYTSFDAVQFFDNIQLSAAKQEPGAIPLMRYRMYQYVIAINHFKDELFI